MRDYLEQLNQRGYAKGTVKVYRYIFRQFENTGFGETSIERFQEKLIQLSPITRENYLIILRKILKDLRPQLVKHVIIPKTPKLLPKNIPNQEEIKRILQEPDATDFMGIRDRALLELLYSSGLRRMEAANLLIEDMDLTKQMVRVTKGKNQKDRLLPISARAVQWIKKYLHFVRPETQPTHNQLFVTSKGNRLTVNGVYAVTKKYSKYSTHIYRHSFATHLLQNGMKETSLQKLLGHSQITTTQRYTKVTLLELKASYQKYHTRDRWGVKTNAA